MTTAGKAADVTMLVLSVILGVGSVVMFATLQTVRWVEFGWPDSLALPWDGLLSLAFFLQHSLMVRRSVKARMARHLPSRYLGAVYAIASGVALGAAALLWQRTERWFVAEGPLRWLGTGLAALAAAGFVWGVASLRGFDPLGLRPIRAHRRGRPQRPAELQIRGAYRWVRHPLYLCVLVLFWSSPELSADRLLFDVLWTAWIIGATFLEERDLAAELGAPYLAYQRRVPMLIPWRRPAAGPGLEG